MIQCEAAVSRPLTPAEWTQTAAARSPLSAVYLLIVITAKTAADSSHRLSAYVGYDSVIVRTSPNKEFSQHT